MPKHGYPRRVTERCRGEPHPQAPALPAPISAGPQHSPVKLGGANGSLCPALIALIRSLARQAAAEAAGATTCRGEVLTRETTR